MQQVPYGIIGAGPMAQHFTYYLSLVNINCIQWSRSQPYHELQELIQRSDRILLLISDKAIIPFIENNLSLTKKNLIHFSGCLHTPLAIGIHPLFTFGPDFYGLETYQKIPFILEDKTNTFNQLLPGLVNPYYSISIDQKPLYHSLCVLSGNFTILLWQKFFKELEETLHIPASAGLGYMQQIFHNLMQDSNSALTGPLARNDEITIKANIDALESDPYQSVYQAFVNAFYGEKKNECS
ncbi:MAG: hypothetical protein LEGION0398_MBIBDBAK_01148 [Legionellaceae bacterium]